MNSLCHSTITPRKLINPYYASVKPKFYKPIKTYLEITKVKPRREKKIVVEKFFDGEKDLELIDIPEFPSYSFRTPKTRNSSKVNKSCKIKKVIESPNSQTRNGFDIPLIQYRNFEPFHLPNVRGRTGFRAQMVKPRLFTQETQEERSEELDSITVKMPKRVEIAHYSKELYDKLIRVKDIVSNIENEFIEDEFKKYE
jgi:hypothetical protein